MQKRIEFWPWLMGAGVLLALAIVVTGQAWNVPLWIGALALIGCGSVFCRSETGRWPSAFLKRWWDEFLQSDWLREMRGRWFRARDDAPAYWERPAQSQAHAQLRADYETLVSKKDNTRAEFLLIAELAAELQRHGDRPLAKPPKIRGFANLAASGGGMLWVYAAVAVFALTGWGWGALKDAQLKAEASAHNETRGKLEDAQVAVARVLAEHRAAEAALDLARTQVAQSVENVEAMARASQRARLRERERNRETQRLLVNDEPPSWEDLGGGAQQ